MKLGKSGHSHGGGARVGRPSPGAAGGAESSPFQAPSAPAARASQPLGSDFAGGGEIPEAQVVFDPSAGHAHSGADSTPINLSGDLSGTNTAATVTKLQGKPVPAPVAGNDQQYVQWNHGAGSFQYSTPATSGPLLDGSRNTDTTASTPVAGDLITANTTPKWTRLALGSANRVLKVVSGAAAWAQVAFSELTGSLGTGQHGTLSDGDHTGALSGNARVGVKVSAGATVGPRRTLNLIPGTNVASITAADDAANEKVDVTINAAAQVTGSVTMGGDVTGSSAASTVAKIRGKTTPSPVAGDDLKLLRYNHSSGAYELVTVNTVATASVGFQGWRRNQIQNSGTTKAEMPGLEGVTTGLCMPYSGTIVAVSVDLDQDLGGTAGTDWYEVEVYKLTPTNPLPAYGASGVKARISATTGNNDICAYGTGSVSFAAGDVLTIYDQRTSGLNASVRAVKASLFVVLNSL